MIRRSIAWAVSWPLFWAGHTASLILDRIHDGDEEMPFVFRILWPIYNKCMVASFLVSEWGDVGVWVKK